MRPISVNVLWVLVLSLSIGIPEVDLIKIPNCSRSPKTVGLPSNTGLFDYHPMVCNASFETTYSGVVDIDTEYIFIFKINEEYNGTFVPRVTVASKNAGMEMPLLVVVTQLTSILSWQIPVVQDGPSGLFTYNKMSRTLCPDKKNGDIVISLSTRSNTSIDFTLLVNNTRDFDIQLSKMYRMVVSPSEPQFVRFKFDNETSSALFHVESADSPCMTLSVQNISCPVYDLERTVEYSGLYQTVLSKGGIFLRKEEFPDGLFIVFVVHSTNEKCIDEKEKSLPNRGKFPPNEMKTFTFELERSIGFWDYIIATVSVLAAFLFIYIAALCFICCSSRIPPLEPLIEPPEDPTRWPPIGFGSSCATTPTTPLGAYEDDSDDLSETDVDMLYEADSSKEILRTKPILFLSDLAQKDPRILSVKSNFYLWNMLTVAVFYALPVVQLVFTYQKVSLTSGNQDLCYYNFLCSHRFGFFADFNHVFSNIGYFLLGLLFIGLTYHRKRRSHSVGSHLGIPYHYGMFYALGVALCMEGVLSACYHLCPNHTNFQFDTSFMYVLSLLSMIKIYQTRHPDITASAYTTFGVLALIIFLGMFGVLNNSDWFYVLFTFAHLLTCFVITAQIYHMGTWKFDLGMFHRFFSSCKNDYVAGGLRHCCRPLYPARMVLLCLANVGNWGLVAIGYFLHLGDFATYMLSIFLANLMMYFIFYIAMKVFCKERILLMPLIYIVLSFAFWAAGLYFFYHKSISWKLTPAESRAYNQPCEILNFYDKHDIWHFLSAGGLFFSFMTLLTLDDDIAEKDRRVIPVF